jgi:hypothetical protein
MREEHRKKSVCFNLPQERNMMWRSKICPNDAYIAGVLCVCVTNGETDRGAVSCPEIDDHYNITSQLSVLVVAPMGSRET